MTQQMSRSGQLQRYEEELHHLEQELAGIKMVPGRTYDLRNRAVPRIVSNLTTSASQSTWAQALPQPQNNLSSAGRITRQERVKTPVDTTQMMGAQAGGVHWSVSQNGRRSPKLFVSPEEDVEYSQLARSRWPATDRREIFYQDEGSDEEMEQKDNPACGDYSRKYLEIVARHKETPWKSETDRVGWNSKDARSTKENAYSQKRLSSLLSLMARAASSPILCS